jgi:hypothetical protein
LSVCFSTHVSLIALIWRGRRSIYDPCAGHDGQWPAVIVARRSHASPRLVPHFSTVAHVTEDVMRWRVCVCAFNRDLMPTLIELATGIAPPAYCDGNSLAPLTKDPKAVVKKGAYSEFVKCYSCCVSDAGTCDTTARCAPGTPIVEGKGGHPAGPEDLHDMGNCFKVPREHIDFIGYSCVLLSNPSCGASISAGLPPFSACDGFERLACWQSEVKQLSLHRMASF